MTPRQYAGVVGDRAWPKTQTIRQRLTVLTVALILPSAFAGAVLLGYSYLKERAFAEFQLLTTARALSIVVDRQIGEAEALIRGLSHSRSLLDGDFTAFDEQARAADPIKNSWIVLRDADGNQLINTRLPRGALLPHDANIGEQRRNLLIGGPHLSNLTYAPLIDSWVVGIDIPVFKEGAMIYDLAIVLKPSEFDRVFLDQKLPPEWIGGIIDREGVVVRRSRDPDRTVGRPVTPDMRQRLEDHEQDGLFDSVSLEGEPTRVAYSRSPTSGWSFAVAVPRDALGAAARRSLYLLIAIGVLLGGVGALAAQRIARGISGPLDSLTAKAAALGRGESLVVASTGLAETDLVGRALSRAGESIRGFTETLEQRVQERTRELADANRRLSNEIDERRRAEAQLAHVQRLEAVGQLAGGIAHDFNNLLQAIIGNIDLAKARVTDSRGQQFLRHALAAADRGARLTAQLLAFSRKQRLETGPLDVNALVAGVVDILQSTIGGSVAIRTDLADPLWLALGDATQLELAIVNLALNARDAMPFGGVITITTANVTRDNPQRLEEPPAGAFVEIAVTDQGTGIPAELLGKVFEPFFTTKEIGKGSGLGLSQVLGLTQQLGGGVVIETASERGTSVRMYLPRLPQ